MLARVPIRASFRLVEVRVESLLFVVVGLVALHFAVSFPIVPGLPIHVPPGAQFGGVSELHRVSPKVLDVVGVIALGLVVIA